MVCYVTFVDVLGTVDKGVVEVTNSFGVPHKEYEDTVSNLFILLTNFFLLVVKRTILM